VRYEILGRSNLPTKKGPLSSQTRHNFQGATISSPTSNPTQRDNSSIRQHDNSSIMATQDSLPITIEPISSNEAPPTNKSRLSVASKMYDINGDGELDDAEKMIKSMDKSGRGYLKNEEVYALMQDHIKTQQQLFRSNKIMAG
jgi:hypothetical protein